MEVKTPSKREQKILKEYQDLSWWERIPIFRKMWIYSAILTVPLSLLLRASLLNSIILFFFTYLVIRLLFFEHLKWISMKGIPGPPANPLLGCVLILRPNDILSQVLGWMKNYGDDRGFLWVRGPIFVPGALLITSSSAVAPIVQQDTPKGFIYTFLHPWLGLGLLTNNGKSWKKRRMMITPCFHFKILRKYIQVYAEEARLLMKKWENAEGAVDIFPDITAMTLDIIGICAFNHNPHAQEIEGSEYVNSIKLASERVFDRVVTPLTFDPLIYGLTKKGREFHNACKIIHHLPEEVIRRRRIAESKGELEQGKYVDFLDLLLLSRDENGEPLSDKDIRDEVNTFMFRGHDTTAAAITWTLYCLAKFPEYQELARKEVDDVLEEKDDPDHTDLSHFGFLEMCIKETLRLYPSVPSITRRLTKPTEIEGKVIPADVEVIIMPYVIHRNPKDWKDPDAFDPFRFTIANSKGRNPYAYIPFSAGNRNCIGKAFALNEEKTVLSMLLKRFTFTLPKDHPEIFPHAHMILRPQGKIQLIIEPRKQKK